MNAQVKEILDKLTIDEKIRLLNGVGDWHTYDANGKLPQIMMTDGPHGIRKIEDEQLGDITGSKPATCFPTASAIASSWNPELIKEMAKGIAREAILEDISIVLGCGCNIKRNPLCGRNFEYLSEDPYLAGVLATYYIDGVISEGVGTSLKHFAANSQETRRMTSNSQVDERALREIYLRAFEMVVKNSNTTTIMASYNKINNEYACANKTLLTKILRNEWGYSGVVVSDWGACIDAVKCIQSGMNLEMPDNRGYHTEVLKKAYEQGELSKAQIDESAAKIIELVLGLVKNKEERDKNKTETVSVNELHENNYELAKKIENESAILLKNEGVLPIETGTKLVVVGELAENMRFQGGGSSHINPAKHKNAIETLTDAGYEVYYLPGYKNYTDIPDEKLTTGVIDYLRKAPDSNVLFFIGLTDSYEGEGYDRTTLNVPGNQVKLLEQISEIVPKEKLAAISFGGAPMDFSWERYVSGILHMYLGGEAVAEAVADLVSGKVSPSGRLAETVPMDLNQVPSNRYFALPHDDVEYRESLFVGYRYYQSFNVPVRYPFGYGLSYTDFEYQNMELSWEDKTLAATVKIKNTGSVAGAETIQVYVCPKQEDFIRSAIELRGFKKIYLEPGETKTITIVLDERSFDVYDIECQSYVTIGGQYTIAAGSSVDNLLLKKEIQVDGQKYSRNERELFPEYFKSHEKGMEISRETFEKLYGQPLSQYRNQGRGQYTIQSSFGDVSRKSLFGYIIRGIVAIGIKFMFPGRKKTDPDMMMVVQGIEEGALEGLIANSGGVVSAKLIDLLVLNANRKYGKAFVRAFTK